MQNVPGHHQAYAYLLRPPRTALTTDAEKRLEAIESAGALGAGFMLASHDLEIRGAGELLGDEQSGQIQQVGFYMYLEMLNRAVESLRKGEIPDVDAPLETGTEVKFHVPALIPDLAWTGWQRSFRACHLRRSRVLGARLCPSDAQLPLQA